MGNLGLYQVMVTVAKKVGGPLVLAAATAVGGWAIGRSAEAGGKGIAKRVKAARQKKAENLEPAVTFTVAIEADCGGGLTLHAGNEFRVLSHDGDAVLIEVLEDADNPYFVSAEILMSISDFPAQGAAEAD